MKEAPFFGFGKEQNYIMTFGQHAVDNYYFWVIMEVGVIGVSAYFLFLYSSVKTALHQYISYKNYYILPLIISMLISIFYQTLVTDYANLIYLYIFAGMICVMKVLHNNKLSILQ